MGVLTFQELAALDSGTVDAALAAVLDSGATAVVALADVDGYAAILTRAAALGMTGTQAGGTYLWVTMAAALRSDYLRDRPALQQALQGSLDVRPAAGSGAAWDRLLAAWRASSYPGAVVNGSATLPYVAETLDAVYAIAYAIQAIKAVNGTPSQATVGAALQNVSFVGASGAVSFGPALDRTAPPPLAVANLVLRTWQEVGRWSPTAQRLTPDAVLWPGGLTTFPPPRQVVHLAGVLPCSPALASGDNSTYLVGVEMCSAFLLACKDLEDMRTFAPGYRIKCTLLKSNGNTTDEEALVRSQMDAVIGFVGDRTSTQSIAMQQVLGPLRIPQVGFGTAVELSNATRYPSFYRLAPSDVFQARALHRLIRNFSWPRVGIISVDSPYARGISDGLAALLGPTLAGYVLIPESTQNTTLVRQQLLTLQGTGVRVVVLAGVGDDCLTVMAAAYGLGMTGARWTWLASDGCTAHPPSSLKGIAGQAMQGLVGLALADGAGPLFMALQARWAALDAAQFPGQVHQGLAPGPRVGITYDAVYAFANALANLSDPGQAMNRTALAAVLNRIDFVGTTGRVQFDGNGDRTPAVYSVVNLLGYSFQTVGSWSEAAGLVWDPTKAVTWPGGSLTPPTGRPHVTVTIGALLPIDPALAANSSDLLTMGLQTYAAFRIACQDMNAKLLAPLELSLNCIAASTEDDPVQALDIARNATRDLVARGAVAVVGALRSSQTAAAHAVAVEAGIPIISPASTAGYLFNATQYTNLFRTSHPDPVEAKALASLWVKYQWDHVAILSTDDEADVELAQKLVAELQAALPNISVPLDLRYPVYSSTPPLDQMARIRDSGATIVFVACVGIDCYWALKAATLLQLPAAKYQFIGTQGLASLAGVWSNLTDVVRWANGVVGTQNRGGTGYLWRVLQTEWAGLDPVEYPGPGLYAAETYDAVMAVAVALSRMSYLQPINGTGLLAQLRSPDFEFNGTTGLVQFDEEQDPRNLVYTVWNLWWGQFNPVATWNRITGLELIANPVFPFFWPGRLTTPPAGKLLRVFTLAGLFPIHPNVLHPSFEAEAAYRLACQDMNAALDVMAVSRTRLLCRTYPIYGYASQPNFTNLMQVTQQAVNDGVDGIIGPENSVNALKVQEILMRNNYLIPEISYASTAVALSNLSAAPTFFRTVPSDAFQGAALAQLVLFFFPYCRQVGVVYTDDVYGAGLALSFKRSATALGIRVVVEASFSLGCVPTQGCDVYTAVRRLKDSGVTIFILLAISEDAVDLLEEARRQGLVADGMTWFGADGIGSEGPNIVARNEVALFQDFLATVPRGGYGPRWAALNARWRTLDRRTYPSTVFTTGALSPLTGEVYDAVLSFAYALDYNAQAGRNLTSANLMQALRDVWFTGTTGAVGFDDVGDRNVSDYLLVNFQASEFRDVGRYYAGTFTPSDVAILWPFDRINAPSSACAYQIVKLYGAFPLNGEEVNDFGEMDATVAGVTALGQQLNAVFHIACDTVNSGSAALQGIKVRLSCETLTSAGSPEDTVALVDGTLQTHIAAGLVGAVRNSHTIALGKFLATKRVVQISPSATAVALDDRKTYPFTYRTAPSLSMQARYLSRLIPHFGWSRVAILASDNPAAGLHTSLDYVHTLSAELASVNVSVLASERFVSSSATPTFDNGQLISALERIKLSGAAVFVVAIVDKDDAAIQDTTLLFTRAAAMGMTGPGWTWLVTGAVASSLTAILNSVEGRSLREPLLGVVGLVPRSGHGTLYDQMIAEWQRRDPVLYSATRTSQVYLGETYDAVLAFAQALTTLVMRQVSLEVPNLSELLSSVMAEPGFQVLGTTGTVAFSSRGDPRYPSFDIVNFQGEGLLTVGSFDAQTGLRMTQPPLWAGGTLKVPADLQPSLLEKLFTSQMEGWVIAIIVIGVVLAVTCAILITIAVLQAQGRPLCSHDQLRDTASDPHPSLCAVENGKA
eukprot:EG_transcript_104